MNSKMFLSFKVPLRPRVHAVLQQVSQILTVESLVGCAR